MHDKTTTSLYHVYDRSGVINPVAGSLVAIQKNNFKTITQIKNKPSRSEVRQVLFSFES